MRKHTAYFKHRNVTRSKIGFSKWDQVEINVLKYIFIYLINYFRR